MNDGFGAVQVVKLPAIESNQFVSFLWVRLHFDASDPLWMPDVPQQHSPAADVNGQSLWPLNCSKPGEFLST
jgi:hypothetical protein